MLHLAVVQSMRVIKWPRSDSDGSCVNNNVRGNKGFYSSIFPPLSNGNDLTWYVRKRTDKHNSTILLHCMFIDCADITQN